MYMYTAYDNGFMIIACRKKHSHMHPAKAMPMMVQLRNDNGWPQNKEFLQYHTNQPHGLYLFNHW